MRIKRLATDQLINFALPLCLVSAFVKVVSTLVMNLEQFNDLPQQSRKPPRILLTC